MQSRGIVSTLDLDSVIASSVDCLGDSLGKTRYNTNDVLSTSLVFESLLRADIRGETIARKRNTEWKLLVTSPECLPDGV